MTLPRCPVCQGDTTEIRAKLICRRCGTILETCCEGGPMGSTASCPPQPPASPAPSAPPDESRRG